jgi:hypothetical protein
MTVIYPVKPGTAAPTITRLDDYTAEIVDGSDRDVISFDPETKQHATLIVNLAEISAGSPAIENVLRSSLRSGLRP